MNKAAQFGRGSYTYISNLQNVSEKMTNLFRRITHPVMRDIKINWRQKNVEQYPQTLSDLYAGEPLTVLVKSDKPIRKISASGKLSGTPWKQSIKLANQQAGDSQNLDTVWARQKIAGLMDKLATNELSRQEVKPLIVKLGIAHGIVSKFTSFVAVEQEASNPDQLKSKHKNTANLMPKGSIMPIPQTGTASNLLALIGCLMLLVGLLSSKLSKRHA
jgi:Ca-activated chloride channel family protein